MLLAVCQEFEIDNEIIPRIASGFGGGIGNTGSVCGAVAGGVMAIGLIMEREDTLEGWFSMAEVVKEFRKRFEAEMETINCSELTGLDFNETHSLEELMNSDIPQTVCFPAVGLAYRLVVDLLREKT